MQSSLSYAPGHFKLAPVHFRINLATYQPVNKGEKHLLFAALPTLADLKF